MNIQTKFDALDSMYPQINHVKVEQSSALPSKSASSPPPPPPAPVVATPTPVATPVAAPVATNGPRKIVSKPFAKKLAKQHKLQKLSSNMEFYLVDEVKHDSCKSYNGAGFKNLWNPNLRMCRLLAEESIGTRSLMKHKLERSRITNPESHKNLIRSLLPAFDHNLVYNLLHSARNLDHALQFFRWVERSGLFKHDRETHYKIIDILGKASKLNHARCILLDMPKKGLKWDEDLFIVLINSYVKADIVQESVKIIMSMEELGIPRTIKSYDTLQPLNLLLMEGDLLFICSIIGILKLI
ncbi:hypothetical protein L2E82_21062 [Cichorium intybus]|uniref:Uncharacterized protein n=1 Tax=Cichorium intybus TaxID=13427 RepID=A0ACB9DV40_CICIN|nr:hypothetical protein L2E82_21062 [Cichorium intybus]